MAPAFGINNAENSLDNYLMWHGVVLGSSSCNLEMRLGSVFSETGNESASDLLFLSAVPCRLCDSS